jgi:hypothetical protein
MTYLILSDYHDAIMNFQSKPLDSRSFEHEEKSEIGTAASYSVYIVLIIFMAMIY